MTSINVFISVVVTEIPTAAGVSVSEAGGQDYSSGCGVLTVGSSWSPGGTHSAAPATSGFLVSHVLMTDQLKPKYNTTLILDFFSKIWNRDIVIKLKIKCCFFLILLVYFTGLVYILCHFYAFDKRLLCPFGFNINKRITTNKRKEK